MKPSITGKLGGGAFNIFINIKHAKILLHSRYPRILVSACPHILIIPYPSSYPQVSCNCSWTESENAIMYRSRLEQFFSESLAIALCTAWVRQQLCNAMEDLLNGTNYAMQCTAQCTGPIMQCIASQRLYCTGSIMQCNAWPRMHKGRGSATGSGLTTLSSLLVWLFNLSFPSTC